MSHDGSVVVAGCSASGSGAGRARAWHYVDALWGWQDLGTPMTTADLVANQPVAGFAQSVACTPDCKSGVAVGGGGVVMAFRWNAGISDWEPLGDSIVDTTAIHLLGASVAISLVQGTADQIHLAAGAPGHRPVSS
jgi:hypothetical protein